MVKTQTYDRDAQQEFARVGRPFAEIQEGQLRREPKLDVRFLGKTDNSRTCWTHFNEYLQCVKKLGADSRSCFKLQSRYRAACPSNWVEEFEESMEENKWQGILPEGGSVLQNNDSHE